MTTLNENCGDLEVKKENKALTQLNLNADIQGLKILKYYCHEVAEIYLKDSDRIFEYILCLDELFVNCILHAYQGKGGLVNIQFKLEDNYIVAYVRDFGIGICEKYIEDVPKLSEDLFCEDGRGLFLVSSLSSKLKIERGQDQGTLIKVYFERMC
ncbi:ATP-binding protein [Geosporobacter ferrireducens]|uniref:Histidine kinase/HSP90-like ATPase domain-containing protein n=1 Tax=Geosporobacter ferrireducens TaxID=1424294 RepID=A0A1D8GFS6_9FIRM|nr:ATP-binding protein [Geosporobacter ferrireducens]AOT69769.1 hypothetical protein Gferi_09335 [Geosporobacter ferrireducens]MTI54519.1 ATP-binding protein [Geosporobacter ferrireducens]